MFSPDADVSPYHPPSSSIQPTVANGVTKSIKHGNTRLPQQNDTSDSYSSSAPPSPTRSRIDAAIAGTPCKVFPTSWLLGLIITIITDRSESPTINNFSLVADLPSPTPSELGPVGVKELMTWGTLNATPRIISQSEDDSLLPPRTPFHIPAPSSREIISHKLSNTASKSLRAKAGLLNSGRTPARTGVGRKGTMPPPSWTPRRTDAAGSLTPAAKRLLDRTTMGTAASRRADAMGRMAGWEANSGKIGHKDLNNVRWTPTPGPVARKG
jgi:protein DGCR14